MELWNEFDRLVVFDTETTGIEFGRDRIIEIGAVALENGEECGNFNALIRLPAGQTLPPFITNLTGITDAQLMREGVDDRRAAEGFCRLLDGAEQPLLVAYNAQFDLNFLYYLLRPLGLLSALQKPRFLDALTVYRDRRDFPHKLCNAIEAYGLTEAENSHRAVDDARATVLLLEAMAAEKDDLLRYIDLFGVHPKYGMSGKKIASVTYCPQPYDRRIPLYDLLHTLAFGAGIIAAVPLQEIDNAPHAQASAQSHNKGLQSINSGRKELHIASISPGFSPAMKKAAHTGGRLRLLDTLSRSGIYTKASGSSTSS